MTKGEMHRRNRKFICTDCEVVFEIYNFFEQRRKYCPKCGDYLAIRTFKKDIVTRCEWSEKEDEVIDQLIDGKIKLYAAIDITGRTKKAVEMRKEKLMRDRGIPERIVKPWEDDEIALIDKAIADEMTLEEIQDITGRGWSSVETFFYRRRRKKGTSNDK